MQTSGFKILQLTAREVTDKLQYYIRVKRRKKQTGYFKITGGVHGCFKASSYFRGEMKKWKHFQKILESEVTEPRQVHLEHKLIWARSTNINRTLFKKPNFPLLYVSLTNYMRLPQVDMLNYYLHLQSLSPLWRMRSGAENSNLIMAWFSWWPTQPHPGACPVTSSRTKDVPSALIT